MAQANSTTTKKSSLSKPYGSEDGQSGTTGLIAIGTIVEGNFNSSESLRVDGKVIGDLHCEKKIVVGETGRLEGNVEAKNLTVKGAVTGKVKVGELLHLNSTAIVEGEISFQRLIVDEGAVLNGDSTTQR